MSYLARVCYVNHIAGSTVSSSSAQTALPDDNIQNPWRTKVWRATGNTVEYLDFDFGSVKSVDQVFAINCNFTSGVTISVLGATNSSFSPVGINVSGITYSSQFNMFQWSFPSTQNYRYWRIKVEDSGNANDIEMGHAFLGPKKEFDYRSNFRIREVDANIKSESYQGQETVYEIPQYKVVDFLVGDHLDLTEIEDIFEEVGTHNRTVYLMLDPNNDSFDNVSDGHFRFSLFGGFQANEYDHRIRGVVNVPFQFKESR